MARHGHDAVGSMTKPRPVCYHPTMLVVPLEPARAELIVSNSRFLASLFPASNAEEARARIQEVRAGFPDATHHVPAFIIGGGKSTTEYCSDDGEPSGTSGRPLLAVLRGSGLGDVVVVVTRWFGGSLLGTGGLVKAYSEAGRRVLALTRRAALVETARLELELPYHLFDRLRLVAAECGAVIVEEDFAEEVRLALDIPVEGRERFESCLGELSAGAVHARFAGSRLARFPLPEGE
jgi:uncharacterized YigZ family protein